MTQLLRQSTLQTVQFGPFLDDTDFKTAETALTIAQADRQISKDGAAFAQSNHTGNSTHDADGWYRDDLDATDTNTVGILKLQVVVSGSLPVWETFYVVEEDVYDALFAASADAFDASGQVTVGAFASGAITAAAIATDAIGSDELATTAVNEIRDAITGGSYALDTDANGRIRIVDGTGAGELDTSAGLVQLLAATQASIDAIEADTNALNDTKIPDTISLANINAQMDTALSDIGLDHLVSAAVTGTDVTDNSIIARMVSSSATADWDSFVNTDDSLQAIRDRGDAAWTTGGGGSAPTAAEVADAVWDELQSGHTTAGTFGELATEIAAILVDTDTTIPGLIATAQADLDTLTGTDGVTLATSQPNYAPATSAAVAALNDVSQADITGGAYALDTDANGRVRIVDGTGAGEIDTSLGRVQLLAATQASIDNIEADTNELQGDWVNGGRLDLILDARASQASVDGLNDVSSADVLTQVNAALDTSIAELGVGQPVATPTLRTGLMLLYMSVRNQREQTATERNIYNDAGTKIAKQTVSDDTTTLTIAKLVSGA